ncbi:BTB/POZ domain-containing protein POB1-like [Aegilops tauschii subsp. strangulata]|uniref:BTB/POZ domain-containing protein POB1-like n=1 Tax=Aegilops tauschii subsp. strangulata TaxID=200361 RepID=UPI003CC8B2B4
MTQGKWRRVVWKHRDKAIDDASARPPEVEEPVVGESFEFAFNNEAFSDRVLKVEVVGSEDAAGSHRRKRRPEEDKSNDGEGINSSSTVTGTPILRVNTIHISSEILAARSPFFFKVFSNGMKESDQRQATLTIGDSEEKAFMELLIFMYSGKLTPTTEPTLLLDILMIADKFEVISCMKLCSQRLLDLPMTPESAVRCLNVPCSISMAAALKEAAKQFLAERYKELLSTNFQDELMRVPLAGIQAILSRNRLGAASEESIYDFVLRWARSRYPNSEVRDKILSSRLLPLVPWVLGMTDDIQIDHPSCIINFTIKREKCCRLVPSGLMRSPSFHCAGRDFFLSACCVTTDQSQFFSLAIKMLEDKGAVRGKIDYEIGAKTRPSLKFVTKYRCTTSTDSMGQDGCCVPWSELMADDNPYFIYDKLHLQIHVKITPLP